MSPSWNLFTAEPLEFNISGLGWHSFNMQDLYVYVGPFDPWAFNAVFVFLGLIMLPVSVLYLVHGGRKGFSTDKLFITLLVFFAGLAFFIGGIMP